MNRRERNPHAKPAAAAARDAVLERRDRLARITGGASTTTDLSDLAPALEAVTRLNARLGSDLERFAEAAGRLALAYGATYRRAALELAQNLEALEKSPRVITLRDLAGEVDRRRIVR